MKHTTITIIAAFVFIYVMAIQTSCANIIPPTGGPRDSLPPVLISAEPKDSALKFTGNKILLTFDEYVQLDDRLSEFMIVSPNPDQPPLVTNKLRTVTVKLKDLLKPNTTYAINFGNGIKDVNEANIFKNFTYVFSTGDSIANGTFSGKVLLAETGDADSTLIVLLHSNLNDSSIKKNKADYYTRLD
ncbi:MAG TPA: Ig-like domain-containing protein, partial [Chitinophagaceae bacterium]|nr:Ig-like domain-containing protein [Chitinophagaceae bacterium]